MTRAGISVGLIAAAWVLAASGAAANSTNTAPYSEAFEEYAVGTSLAGTGGWYVASGGKAVVTNDLYPACHTGGYPVDTNHALVLHFDDAVTNKVTTPTNTRAWADFTFRRWHTQVAVADEAGNEQFQVYVSNEVLSVRHLARTGRGVTVSDLESSISSSNDWVRMTIELDYENTSAQGFHFFRLLRNSVPYTSANAATNSVGQGSGGEWFCMLSKGTNVGSVIFRVAPSASDSAVDDLVVTTAGVPLAPYDRSAVTIAATDASASEQGFDPGTCVVMRAGGEISRFITVPYTIGGTAGNGIDYEELPGYVDMAAGQTTAVIRIRPYNTRGVESAETVVLTLKSNAYCHVAAPSNTTVTIESDETESNRRHREPCTHRTGIIISEIMYNPAKRADSNDLEYVELFNTDPVTNDIGGLRLSGEIDYVFPDGTLFPPRSYIVVAKDPAAMDEFCGVLDAYGPYSNRLSNGGGTLRLRNAGNAILLEIDYSDDYPWPAAAGGAGHSLTMTKPDYGEGNIRAWEASSRKDGSPGSSDPYSGSAYEGVVINEFLAHTDVIVDFIEIYNCSTTTVDLGGCWLSDEADTNKFRIPGGTLLAPREFAVFYETNMGFSLFAGGEAIYLVSSNRDMVIDAVKFEAQENGVSYGRSPDGAPGMQALASRTAGATNSEALARDIVINEIMFHPLTGDGADEYVEIYNRGTGSVYIGHWRFTEGIDYMFPSGTVIAAGDCFIVAKNATNMIANYSQLTAANTFGNFGGGLSDHGERIVLRKPDDQRYPDQDLVIVDEVMYGDGWGKWSDGGGSSLELTDPDADNSWAMNWEGSDESASAPWTTIVYTQVLANGEGSPSEFRVFMLQEGECLIDDIEVVCSGTTNYTCDFTGGLGSWLRSGNHARSEANSSEGAAAPPSLHVRASGKGDGGGDPFLNHLVDSGGFAGAAGGQTAVVRAKARWLKGWPYVALEVGPLWAEVGARLEVPLDLGTPGLQNSQYATNAGPALTDVQHYPVLPASGEDVVVRCRANDPDGISVVQLRWRMNGSGYTTTVGMVDTGVFPDLVAGDGEYAGTIPGQGVDACVAFTVRAVDLAGGPAESRFPGKEPPGAPPLECIVQFGKSMPDGDLGMYWMWMTTVNRNRWLSVGDEDFYHSNEPIDVTLVVSGHRAIYNAGARWRGLWRPYSNNPENGAWSVNIPKSERFCGDAELKLDFPGQWWDGGDPTFQQENYCFWTAKRLGTPVSHIRFVRVRVDDGVTRVYHDLQTPAIDFCHSWFDDDDPIVHKNVGGWGADPLVLYESSPGKKDQGRYRWHLRKRRPAVADDDFSGVFKIVDVTQVVDNDTYDKRVAAVIDIRGWASYFAVNGALENWDAYGTPGLSHNMAVYLPRNGRSFMFLYDMDYAFAGAGLWPATGTPNRMFNRPAFRRVYWRYLKELVEGPMSSTEASSMMQEWHDAFVANGLSPTHPQIPLINEVETYRSGIQVLLDPLIGFDLTVNTGNFTTNASPVTIQGTAPIQVSTVKVNSVAYPVKWTGETTWDLEVGLVPGTNTLTISGWDDFGAPEGDDVVKVTYTGPELSPSGKVIISEIMYHSAEPYADYVELHNLSTTETYDLGGLRLNGIDHTFGYGSFIGPQEYRVVASCLPGYQFVYTNAEVVLGEYGGSLDDGGETISLLMPVDMTNWAEIDRVRYDDGAPWPIQADGRGPSLQLMDLTNDNNHVANWAVDEVLLYTPGLANSISTNLPPIPPMRINEVMPSNTAASGITDNYGDPDPWVEIWNGETNVVDLGADSYYLTDDYSNLTKWAFPPGFTINAGSQAVVWVDAEPGETAGQDVHTGFRINSVSGVVALVIQPGSTPFIVDYLEYYASIGGGYSYGSYPDGNPLSRQVFHYPTPGGWNNPASSASEIYINEWMAKNTDTILDPVDSESDDWFELYNPGTGAVDLIGFKLVDAQTNVYEIVRSYMISQESFMVVWADNETGQNDEGPDLHVNFKLGGSGDAILLYAPDDTLVDYVVFGAQEPDVGGGRWPDGEPSIYEMAIPTPGGTNKLFLIETAAVTGSTMTVNWSTRAGRDYRVLFTSNLIDAVWQQVGNDMPATGTLSTTNLDMNGPRGYYTIRQLP